MRGNLKAMQECIKIKISEDTILEVDIEETIEMIIMKEVGVCLEKGNIQAISEKNDRSDSNSRLKSGSRPSTITFRIRCYKCREYDHFINDCPKMTREERETEQIQQMFNLDKEQTTLKNISPQILMTVLIMEAHYRKYGWNI